MGTAREVARAAAGGLGVLPRLLGLALLAGLWLVLSATSADADLTLPAAPQPVAGTTDPVEASVDAAETTDGTSRLAEEPVRRVGRTLDHAVGATVKHTVDETVDVTVDPAFDPAVDRTVTAVAEPLRPLGKQTDQTMNGVSEHVDDAAATGDQTSDAGGPLPRLPALPPDPAPAPAPAPAGPASVTHSLDLLGDSRVARGLGSDPSGPADPTSPTRWALFGGPAPSFTTAPAGGETSTHRPTSPTPPPGPGQLPHSTGTPAVGTGPSGADHHGPLVAVLAGSAFVPGGPVALLVAGSRRRPRSRTSRPGSSPD